MAPSIGYCLEKKKKKGPRRKAKCLEIFFFPVPLHPNYCLLHPENLFLSFPGIVQTAAAFLSPLLSYIVLTKFIRAIDVLNYGGTSQICTCSFYFQITKTANLSDSVSCCFRIALLKLQELGSYFLVTFSNLCYNLDINNKVSIFQSQELATKKLYILIV